ncbi:MAG: DUF389 domain-containing protein [Candidatus Tectomicrobia bacterium]|uniref:DUF389 domain-containing protein n=1 Tax=Tectimicrobiota bacterium TaxID=2528274 RepID=A0A932G1J6_UNCTE|nr:DUF389 domain-containing protein [Candidatus Tectomicrobia bacterium]
MHFWGIVIKTAPERRRAVYQSIVDFSTPTGSFYVLVALSTTIAAYGLLANSTAVIIGAMLVAPLMGPIFGIALSLLTGDRHLLRQAATSEMLGVMLAVGLAVLIGLVPWREGSGSEIVARIQPTIYDLIIALASGLAGAYALMDERIGPALPGVAISTALVPPLATCGLCLAVGRWDWALGAFLLFFANFLAIEIAAALVFALFGMAELHVNGTFTFVRFLRRFSLSFVALIVIAVFMTQTLLTLIAERRFSRAVEEVLSKEVHFTVGAYLSQLRYEKRENLFDVIAIVLTPQEFHPPQVAHIEEALRKQVDPRIRLVMRSLISKDVDRNGFVFIAEKKREPKEEVDEATQFLVRASHILNQQFKQVLGASLVDIRRENDGKNILLTAVVHTPTVIDPIQITEIERVLQHAIGAPVRLVVRSILTRDADAQRYIYEVKKEPEPLVGEALEFHQQLEIALKDQLKRIEGTSLMKFHYAQRDGRLPLLAVVRTPRSIRPAQVRRIERALRRHVHPETDLIVRSIVGTDTAATGYLSDFDEAQLTSQPAEERKDGSQQPQAGTSPNASYQPPAQDQ